jgi:hypothetical protein
MKTVVDLRNELIDVFDRLRKGELSAKDAKELTNAAGKIINSTKVQLEYATLREETPDIAFLNNTKGK